MIPGVKIPPGKPIYFQHKIVGTLYNKHVYPYIQNKKYFTLFRQPNNAPENLNAKEWLQLIFEWLQESQPSNVGELYKSAQLEANIELHKLQASIDALVVTDHPRRGSFSKIEVENSFPEHQPVEIRHFIRSSRFPRSNSFQPYTPTTAFDTYHNQQIQHGSGFSGSERINQFEPYTPATWFDTLDAQQSQHGGASLS